MSRPQFLAYGLLVVLVVAMLLIIELQIGKRFAPELVVIRPPQDAAAATAVVCNADIYTADAPKREAALRQLESIYDVLDPQVFHATNEDGYYALSTGLVRYQGEFEIEIRCSVPGEDEFSYMVINNESNKCGFSGEGGTMLC